MMFPISSYLYTGISKIMIYMEQFLHGAFLNCDTCMLIKNPKCALTCIFFSYFSGNRFDMLPETMPNTKYMLDL